MRTNKGFTLIELAVVLAIIAVLAAVLTPVVTNYVEQARITRTTADTRSIADAVRLHKRDTGFYPIYATLAAARAGTITTQLLVGPGSNPSDTQGEWAAMTATSDLATILNLNLGFSTASEVSNPGRAAYRGPYIGAVEADPWGNRYIVTATNLGGTANRGFVVSAGPDGSLDADPTQGVGSFTIADDDIGTPIN